MSDHGTSELDTHDRGTVDRDTSAVLAGLDAARRRTAWLTDIDETELTVQHSPMRYGDVPLIPLKPSSRLGADGRDVFVNWLGLPQAEFDGLVKEGVL